MTEELKIAGLDELREVLLRRLPEALQGKALQATLAKAAAPIVKAARGLAPAKTGRLRRAIYSFRDRDSKRTYEARLISVRRGKKLQKSGRDAYYWKFVEFGHMTRRGRGKEGPPRFVPAQPFMRPAFEANKYRALQIVQDELRGQVAKVAKRAQSRSASRLGRGLRHTFTGF